MDLKHKFIVTNNSDTNKYKYTELVCTICEIHAYSDHLAKDSNYGKIFIYKTKNGLGYTVSNLDLDKITCEEFIIKKIIE